MTHGAGHFCSEVTEMSTRPTQHWQGRSGVHALIAAEQPGCAELLILMHGHLFVTQQQIPLASNFLQYFTQLVGGGQSTRLDAAVVNGCLL